MNPQFDDKDAAILARLTQIWDAREGPRVGDFCRMPDGALRRFTHDWGDAIQTTCSLYPSHGSFYFADGHASYSGGLDPSIPKSELADSGETKDGAFWFFHHDYATAHNGVHFKVRCRVFEHRPLA